MQHIKKADFDRIHGEVEEAYLRKARELRALFDRTETADYDGLTTISESCADLERICLRLRHLHPNRRRETPQRRAFMTSRYFLVWPDGELVGYSGYSQRPAALRKLRHTRLAAHPEIRLWDSKESQFIEPDIPEVEGAT